MSVDLARKRISLSIKQVGDDPWVGSSARWPANSVVKGKVKRVTDFGAFVEVAPGVEGLVHISEISETRIRVVSDALKEGQEIDAKVLEVDEDAKRMSLSIKKLATIPDYAGTAEPEPAAAEAQPEAPAKPQPKRKVPLKGGF
jgi:small subunit ribosomal protein S1